MWLKEYAATPLCLKRLASASSHEPPVARINKRPAAAPAKDGPPKKRPAAAPASAISAASSSSAPAVLISITGPDDLEKTCGEKYRREVADLGFGHARGDMVKTLRTWGYEASREACREWLRKYRTGNDGAKDGGVGV